VKYFVWKSVLAKRGTEVEAETPTEAARKFLNDVTEEQLETFDSDNLEGPFVEDEEGVDLTDQVIYDELYKPEDATETRVQPKPET